MNESCAEGAFCDSSSGEKLCAPRRKLGESCKPFERDFTVGNCLEGLCHCSDADCLTGTCVERRDEGAACGAENVLCIPGTVCQEGRCVAVASQGLAQACSAP